MTVPASPIVLRVGDALPTRRTRPLTRTDVVRYAGAAGDFNPIHHDEPFARAAGVDTVFGMGLLHAGMLGVALARWVGPDSIRSFSVRFSARVWPGDVLEFRGAVTAIDAERLATLDLAVVRQTGELAARAVARVATAGPVG